MYLGENVYKTTQKKAMGGEGHEFEKEQGARYMTEDRGKGEMM